MVNFINFKPLAYYILACFALIIALFVLWVTQGWNPLISLTSALFTVSLIVFVCVYIVILISRFRREDLEPQMLYCEFTTGFLIFPLFIFSLVAWALSTGELESRGILTLLDLFIPVIFSLIPVWLLSSLIIQASESIINGKSPNSKSCQDSIFHYLYKQNLQIRCYFIFSFFVVLTKEFIYDTKYMQVVIAALGFSSLVLSISEIFLVKKIFKISIVNGLNGWRDKGRAVCQKLKYAPSEIYSIKKIFNTKVIDGFSDWLDKRRGVYQNLKYAPLAEGDSSCVSPRPGEKRGCISRNIGYWNCEKCKRITSE